VSHPSPESPARRYPDIDGLRVFGILAVFVFHCAHFFDFDTWHVNNPVRDGLIHYTGQIIIIWLMPLFFLLSGVSARFTLDARGPGRFMKSKVFRLLIPFLFGTLVLVPHQVYIERVTQGDFSGSLLAFLPHYFDGWYGFGGNFAWMGLHLWYLEFLFVYSILLLPLFLLLRGKRVQKALIRFFSRRGTLYLLAVPPALLEIFLDPRGLGMRVLGGWGILTYLVVFVSGYAVFSAEEIRQAAARQRRFALGFGSAALSGLAFMAFGGFEGPFGTPQYGLMMGLRSLTMGAFMVFLVGIAHRRMQRQPQWMTSANEAVLPVYMLHQSVIVAVGFFIMNWTLHPLLKWPFLMVVSAVLVLLLYLGLVRPWNPLRFLFGMKPRRR